MNTSQKRIKALQMLISLLLHTSLLLINIKCKTNKPITAYSIQIQTSTPNLPETPKDKSSHQPPTSTPDNTNISDTTAPSTTKNSLQKNTKKHTQNDPIEKSPTSIDKRSIYSPTDTAQKQTTVQLDMHGWEWDSAPYPDDNTSEIGKVIFEITIDSTGFVIGIKEIEKSITPQLSTLYKDSLTKLTFSRSSQDPDQTPTTKGRVTFILHPKK